jgi:protein-S-isoprenylcysteine O-methyltransferase Ste14
MPGNDNQKSWDKYVQSISYIAFFMWLAIMPLDAKRFEWTKYFPLWLKILGGFALIPALYFIYRATAENTFLSAMVRIQDDRKQHVISTGVYGFVRHPLYLGCLLMLLGGPLMLGSKYSLIIGLIAVFMLAGRIIGEEKMLVNELEGYKEYREKVKYRLLPFIW